MTSSAAVLPNRIGRALRVPRNWWEWVAPILLVAAMLGIGEVALSQCRTPAYRPLTLMHLDVEPDTLQVGQGAYLVNGVCNHTSAPVQASVYMGLEDASGDPILVGRSVDLVGTPSARVVRTIPPGCSPGRIAAIVPATIPPGVWRLTVRLTAVGPHGEIQNITEQSRAFEVLGP